MPRLALKSSRDFPSSLVSSGVTGTHMIYLTTLNSHLIFSFSTVPLPQAELETPMQLQVAATGTVPY